MKKIHMLRSAFYLQSSVKNHVINTNHHLVKDKLLPDDWVNMIRNVWNDVSDKIYSIREVLYEKEI